MSMDSQLMITLYTNLIRANEYDLTMYSRMMSGRLLGFYHPSEGGIAPGVAVGSILRKDDIFTPHHRAHGMPGMLAKGADLRPYLAEHTGKQGGCCAGRSSFHMHFPEQGQFLFSGYIGYQFAPSVGWGWAAKQNKLGQVVVVGSGDGAYGQGRAHEAMLMAQNWKLPVVFWCENNGMAIHSTAEEMHPTADISSLAQGFGMPAMIVDGQDVFACAEAAIAATERARSGKGPVFVEAKTCRYNEHDIGTPDLVGDRPRTKEEINALRERDPIAIATKRMLDDGLLSLDQIEEIKQQAKQEVEAAWAWADEQPLAQPSEEALLADVYAP